MIKADYFLYDDLFIPEDKTLTRFPHPLVVTPVQGHLNGRMAHGPVYRHVWMGPYPSDPPLIGTKRIVLTQKVVEAVNPDVIEHIKEKFQDVIILDEYWEGTPVLRFLKYTRYEDGVYTTNEERRAAIKDELMLALFTSQYFQIEGLDPENYSDERCLELQAHLRNLVG